VHVLIIPSWYPSHPKAITGSFFREQVLGLKKHGCTVGVIHPQQRTIRNWRKIIGGRYGLQEEIDSGIPTLRWHGTAWLPRVPYLRSWLWIRDGLRLYNRYVSRYGSPDLIHAHATLFGGLLAAEIRKRDNVPFIITEHSSAYAGGAVRRWQMHLARAAATDASRRLAVSDALMRLLDDRFGEACGPWETLPNMVSKSFSHHPLPMRKTGRNGFAFATVASLTKKKGVSDLIEAFNKAFATEPAVFLLIIGDGVERDHLEDRVRQLGLTNRVHFLGELTRQDVVQQLSSVDAFVLPSLYETFGVALIESLALGKPVVATRSGGPDSVVRPQDGLLVQPGNPGQLAIAMQALQRRYDQYDSLEIRHACIARFGEDVICAQIRRVYDEVLATV
jgi:glycosyltransferase involved in cell wall biosynthesis